MVADFNFYSYFFLHLLHFYLYSMLDVNCSCFYLQSFERYIQILLKADAGQRHQLLIVLYFIASSFYSIFHIMKAYNNVQMCLILQGITSE
jgi:hypothetical protein